MKIDKEKSVFLLGGKDLEMIEIKSLLDGYIVKDKELSWSTAKLTAYAEELEDNPNKTFYAIELNIDEEDKTDKEFLKKYDINIIDHHGEKHNNKEASLLQILKILNQKPTRDQELVAANDARYINGMKCICATDDEIADIRKRDRKMQGVTESDMLIAKNDVKSRKVKNGISLVYASTDRFSAVTDSLYFEYGELRSSKKIG